MDKAKEDSLATELTAKKIVKSEREASKFGAKK
jgi:hypothetical protein